ncbi:pectinesterase family protein [Bacillus solitudinis]|uniref:pectinesterase family protein n=1 Tax=Bacillus solitudinis TaxID=2014074 RepID=UPI000C248BF2|nr:pectinesterase family protein [Bacillus solitudinis]
MEGYSIKEATVVVDQIFTGCNGEIVEGKQTFKFIQSAVDSVEPSANQPCIIYIKKGIYHEKVEINKPGITLIGEDRDETILTYNVANGSEKADGSTYGTSGSASITVNEEDFTAFNVTFENAFDYFLETNKEEDDSTKIKNVQAVAFCTASNSTRTRITNCRFRSVQDTLLTNVGTHYFKECVIEGAVDFIFGGGQAVFDNCKIISLDRRSETNNGYITAASTLITQPYGFLFENCMLVKETEEMADHSVYLGRAWQPGGNPDAQGSVLFKNCEMGSHIKQNGWTQMAGFSPMDARLYEYGSKGPGALSSDSRRILSEKEAIDFSKERVLKC